MATQNVAAAGPEQQEALAAGGPAAAPTAAAQGAPPAMESLRAMFSKCLKHGLREPTLQVSALGHSTSPIAGELRAATTTAPPCVRLQSWAARFPGIPLGVLVALHDNYLQMLGIVEHHSHVRMRPCSLARVLLLTTAQVQPDHQGLMALRGCAQAAPTHDFARERAAGRVCRHLRRVRH